MIAPPLTVVMQEDGKIGFSLTPKTAIDRTILVGILQQAVIAMSQIPVEETPQIVTATTIPDVRGRNGR
jgi:hypothetical protein